jgi:hypothetical protein
VSISHAKTPTAHLSREVSNHVMKRSSRGAPVNSLAVLLLHDLLWRHVHVCADERSACRRFAYFLRLYAAAEIGYNEVAVALHQNILRFEVPVQDAGGMQRFDTKDDLSKVKLQHGESQSQNEAQNSFSLRTLTSFSSMGERASMCCSSCPPLA